MSNLYRFFALYGAVCLIISFSMCHGKDAPTNTGESPWDSILSQKMPLSDCSDEMRDSSESFSQRLSVLEQIARIQAKRQTYMQPYPDPAYNVIFRQQKNNEDHGRTKD